MRRDPFKIIVLISGHGSNLQAIIDTIQQEKLNIAIVAVISDRPGVYGLTRAEKAGIPGHVIDYMQFTQRSDFDTALMQQIEVYTPDLIVLAGFMRILTPEFVENYLGKMINIHPSLLPKYQGLDTHTRALQAGEAEHGATVHYVTAELDSGPIILQARVKIEPDETPQTLQQRIHKVEHQIYPAAIKLIATGQVAFRNNQVYYGDKPMTAQQREYASA